MRKPDLVTSRQYENTAIRATETFELGFWEAGQITVALDELADSMSGQSLSAKLHTRDLAAIFAKGCTVTVTVHYQTD